MRKIIFTCIAAFCIFAVGCININKRAEKDTETVKGSNYNGPNEELYDSISTEMGRVFGGLWSSELNQLKQYNPEYVSKIDKKEFIKGLELAFSLDTANYGYDQGVAWGMQINAQLQHYAALGVELDRKLILKAFKKTFMIESDSIDNSYGEDYQKLNELIGRIVSSNASTQEAAAPVAEADTAAVW